MILKNISVGIAISNTFTFLLLLSLSFNLTACKSTAIPIAQKQDTLIPSKKEYLGYRLQIANIKVENNKGNQRKINCTLINTGRERVRLPYKSSDSPRIIFQYDQSIEDADLAGFKNNLERAVLKKKFTLDAGKITSNFSLKFNISKEELANNSKKEKKKKSKYKSSSSSFDTNIYDKEYCPDLQIDTFFVEKRGKKWVELAFKITNYGKGPAAMFGETKDTEDNVAVRAYVSGTAKLSRGDMILGGAFIEGGLSDKNGLLMPNESFSGSFKVDIKKKTRYTPFFILSVDDYQSLWECDERNNVKSLLDRNR